VPDSPGIAARVFRALADAGVNIDMIVQNVSANGTTDISFTIHRGEILGLAGVEGNGQGELVETIMGIRKAVGGRILLGAEDMTRWETRERRDAGIGYIPEDRQRHGLLLDSPLWENRILGHQTKEPSAKGWLIDRSGARADTRRIVEEFDVRTPGIDTVSRALSGGNQQISRTAACG